MIAYADTSALVKLFVTGVRSSSTALFFFPGLIVAVAAQVLA
jgi:hypothetical protein